MLTLPICFLLITVVSSLDSNKTTSDFIEQQLHLSYECEASKHCYHSPSGCIQTKDCTGGFSIGLLDSRDPSLGTVYEVYVVEKDIPFTSNTYAAVKTTNIETGEVEMRLCFPHEARAIVAYPSLDSLEVDESHPLSFVSSAVSLNSNAVTCVFKDSRNVDDFSKVHISSEVVYGEMSDRIFFPPKGRMRIAGETKLDTSDIGKMENKEKEDEEDFFNTEKIINEAKIDSKKKEKSIEKVQPQLSEEDEEKNIKNATVNDKLSSTTAKIPSTKATTPKVIVKLTTTSTTVSTTKKVSTTTVAPTTVPSESIEEEEDEESEEMRNEIEKKKEERNRLKEMIENDEMDRIKDLITEKVESAVEKQREHMEKEIMKKIEAEESEKEKKNNGNKKNTQSVSNVDSKKSESTIQREQFEKRENEGFRSMDDEESEEKEEKVEKKKTKDVKKGENTDKKEDDYEIGEEDEVKEKKEGGGKSTTQPKKHPKDIRSGDAESLDGEDDSSSTVSLFICVLFPLLLTL